MEVILQAEGDRLKAKGNKKGITEIIQQVIAQDPDLNKPGIEDSIIQILEFLLTGQPKQKGDQDGLTKTVIDVVSGIPFMYEYTYNAKDQLTSLYDPVTDKEYSYSYDIRGNLTSKQDYYGSYAYTWDFKNRLTEVNRLKATGDRLQVKYTYDSKNRRTSKTVIDTSSSVIPAEAGIQTHTYKYDGWAVMEETIVRQTGDPSATPQDDEGNVILSASEESQTIRYTYSGDSPIAITLGDSTYYYITDGHGDIREVTDSVGNILVKYSYDAFGSISTTWTSKTSALQSSALQLLASNPYRYASYRYDSDTGLYYLRARYYDPVTGRFLSRDPILKESISKSISDIGKANPFVKDIADELVNDIKQNHPYAYAKNNPLNKIDPSGLHVGDAPAWRKNRIQCNDDNGYYGWGHWLNFRGSDCYRVMLGWGGMTQLIRCWEEVAKKKHTRWCDSSKNCSPSLGHSKWWHNHHKH